MKSSAVIAFGLVTLLCAGCPIVAGHIGELAPHPRVSLPADIGPLAVDTRRVPDDGTTWQLTSSVEHWRVSLENGFRNAVPSRVIALADAQHAYRLVFDETTPSNNGRFYTIHYRARWMSPDDHAIVDVTGDARPKDDAAAFRLDDVISAMYEQLFEKLRLELELEPQSQQPARREASARAPIWLESPRRSIHVDARVDGEELGRCETPCTLEAPPGRVRLILTNPRQIDRDGEITVPPQGLHVELAPDTSTRRHSIMKATSVSAFVVMGLAAGALLGVAAYDRTNGTDHSGADIALGATVVAMIPVGLVFYLLGDHATRITNRMW